MNTLYTSTKPTTYLIDGCNLVRSFLYEFARTEDEVTADFLDFLEDMSCDPRYSMHTYEVIFDGAFRPVGPLYRAGYANPYLTLTLHVTGYRHTRGLDLTTCQPDGTKTLDTERAKCQLITALRITLNAAFLRTTEFRFLRL